MKNSKPPTMDTVDVRSLRSDDSGISENDIGLLQSEGFQRNWPKSPFPVNTKINDKVVLYDGDLSLVRAEAIVNPTNENLSQLDVVEKLAGPALEHYIKTRIRLCSTGNVKITPGFKSNFTYIIHAVPPKYQEKFQTAAETALFNTYFRILEAMIEKRIRTVVMPILTTQNANLPFEDNIHMQSRVIRRMMEKRFHDFDKIVVYIYPNETQNVAPFFCYFPRSQLDEEYACHHLSTNIGGIHGEPLIPERKIRIKGKPTAVGRGHDCSVDLSSGLDLSVVVGKTPFSKMQDDLKKQYNGSKPSSPNQVVTVRKSVFQGCTLL